MKLKWKNVNPYSGIEEDAPVNSVAGGGVAMPPDALYSKKKKKELQNLSSSKKALRFDDLNELEVVRKVTNSQE